jgi:outer membrane cobalamin receptor
MRTVWIWALAALPLAAQKGAGELWIEVADASGRSLEAEGELTGKASHWALSFRTDALGNCRIVGIPFGPYLLKLSRPGFESHQELVEIRSEVPVRRRITLGVAPVETVLVIRERETLVDPRAVATAYHLTPNEAGLQRAPQRSRDLIELVNTLPGWLLEANGVLHPRGSEYNTQYVVDGVPITDNRSPAFAPGLELEDLGAIRVLTGGYPAEYGRKLGGVIEVNPERNTARGLHGRASASTGSFSTQAAYASLQATGTKTAASLSAGAGLTERFLDPPSEENLSNRGSGAGLAGRLERDFTDASRLSLYGHRKQVSFLAPNEPPQEAAGQRQDRHNEETMAQAAYKHVLSPHLIADVRAMGRDYEARLWSNPFSTPMRAEAGRGFRELYGAASLSWQRGRHSAKAGGEVSRTRLNESLAFQVTGEDFFDEDVPDQFEFSERGTASETGLYAQELVTAGAVTVSLGLRWDRYRLRAPETAWSPRLGVGYWIGRAGLRLHAAYDRAFETPAIEGILVASSPLMRELTKESTGLPIRPSRSNFLQAGLAKSLWGRLRLEANLYRRRTHNFADDSLLLNTGYSFPITFAEADIGGAEARLELPAWRGVSGYVSYSHMRGTGRLPLTGGLFLERDTARLLAATDSFPITQDQRHTLRSRWRWEVSRRVWLAGGGAYDSGLPFEREETEIEPEALRQRFSERILSRVDFSRGRVRPQFSLDASAGALLYASERARARLQADVWNLTGRLNVVNFSGLFSGTALARPRSAALRLSWEF